MTQRRPLVDALIEFQKKRPISFHVPGHKHGQLSELPETLRSALAYDQTELAGLDDLHYPESVIREAQSLLAQTYGADQSYFLVNGSTVGNLAMIQAVSKEGDRIIVQRNSHKSVFHALEFGKVRPVYVSPEWDEKSMTPAAVSLAAVQEAISLYPDAKAVVLTYPNYYGMCADELKDIIAYSHAQGLPVLVDEAHGAHFQIGGPYPPSALSFGADVVVHSAHKTLPAMTMGSFLHIQGDRVNRDKINKYLRVFQSSSPSYLIMASLDDARAFIDAYSQSDIRSFEEKRKCFIDSLRTIPQVDVVESDDPLKILLRAKNHSGFQLQEKMEQVGIYAELADPYQVLLIMPLLKRQHSYPFAEIRSRVKEAVHLLKEEPRKRKDMEFKMSDTVSVPEISFEEIDLADSEWISYNQAIGRISATMVIPYPPGVPLVLPGEKWTMSKLEQLVDYLAADAAIQGEHRLDQKQLSVIQQGGKIHE